MFHPCSKYSQIAGSILSISNEKKSINYFLRLLKICVIISNQILNIRYLNLLMIIILQSFYTALYQELLCQKKNYV